MSSRRFNWKYDAQASAKTSAPDPGRDHKPFARELASRSLHRSHTTARDSETIDWCFFEDSRAEVTSAIRHAADEYVGAQMPIVWIMDSADDGIAKRRFQCLHAATVERLEANTQPAVRRIRLTEIPD
jgi:hypothetical protein